MIKINLLKKFIKNNYFQDNYPFTSFNFKLIDKKFEVFNRIFDLNFQAKYLSLNINLLNKLYLETNKNKINKFKLNYLGYFYKILNNNFIFRNYLIFKSITNISRNKILIDKYNLVAILPIFNQQTADITQGLPKIEKILGISSNFNSNIYKFSFNFLCYNSKKHSCIFTNNDLYYYYSNKKIISKPFEFKYVGQNFLNRISRIPNIILNYYSYFLKYNNKIVSILKSFEKINYLILKSFIKVYIEQGLPISSVHFQIVIKQMSGFLLVLIPGDTPLLIGETISINFLKILFNAFKGTKNFLPEILPYMKSVNYSVPSNNSILSSISFQNTQNLLLNISIKGSTDWITSVKSNMILYYKVNIGSNFNKINKYLS